MKIENQPPLIIKKLANGASNPQQSSFDSLIDTESHARQDDDYYWQHQHQLQQSDITFNAKPQELSNPGLSDNRNPRLSTENREQSIENDLDVMVSIVSEALHPEKIEPPTNDNRSVNTTAKILHLALQAAIVEHSRGLDVMAHDSQTNVTNLSQQPMLALASVFKHYQLFLDGNQVELTLNTTHLSKQQVSELHTFIREWLNQKGFTLKQLILNGEQQ